MGFRCEAYQELAYRRSKDQGSGVEREVNPLIGTAKDGKGLKGTGRTKERIPGNSAIFFPGKCVFLIFLMHFPEFSMYLLEFSTYFPDFFMNFLEFSTHFLEFSMNLPEFSMYFPDFFYEFA